MKIRKYRYNKEITGSQLGKTPWFEVVNTHTVNDVLDVIRRDNPHCLVQRRKDMENTADYLCFSYTRDDEEFFVYIDITQPQ